MNIQCFQLNEIQLLPSTFLNRYKLNHQYVCSLKNDALLQNFLHEAGILNKKLKDTTHRLETYHGEDMHWGWESPTCQLRGHFLGHWLSAAALIHSNTKDAILFSKISDIIDTLERCQKNNGGEWLGSIPTKYLDLIAKGEYIWAPHYTLHKTLMGLFDVWKYLKLDKSLQILINFAEWFYKWSNQWTKEEFANILDYETGGMMEAWADLYSATGDSKHYELMSKYERSGFFEGLLKGHDMLTNYHANTTIPEVHGAARAYEVTAEQKWRDITEAYWDCAVSKRGTFCTGGQTSGEIWTAPQHFFKRLGDKNQEHCVVYNMIRLADYLYRWTGKMEYADYIERNIYNGILAQQNKFNGKIAYFLPLEAGSTKHWGSETNDFWCCHGTLVQGQANYLSYIYYLNDNHLDICQFIPSTLDWNRDGIEIKITMSFENKDTHKHSQAQFDNLNELTHSRNTEKPQSFNMHIHIQCSDKIKFIMRLRKPSWAVDDNKIHLNDKLISTPQSNAEFYTIDHEWLDDTITIKYPTRITMSRIPDKTNYAAFMDGPYVLAGLIDHAREMEGDINKPEEMIEIANEREWALWLNNYQTHNQSESFKLKPLFEITDETYTVYFPINNNKKP